MRASAKFDESYWGSGLLIGYAIKKYGVENFSREVLHWCTSPAELVEREVAELVNRNAAKSVEYYNIINTKTPILFGKDNGFYGKKHSDKSRRLISEKNSGSHWTGDRREAFNLWKESEEYDTFRHHLSELKKGKPLSSEHKNKITDSFTDEVRERISERVKKFYLSEEGIETRRMLSDYASKRFAGVSKTAGHKDKISAALLGKPHEWQDKINKNPEKIRKTADKHTGMTRSDAAKKNMSLSKKGKASPNIGKKYYYNPVNPDEKTLCREQHAPQGWINGIYKKR